MSKKSFVLKDWEETKQREKYWKTFFAEMEKKRENGSETKRPRYDRIIIPLMASVNLKSLSYVVLFTHLVF